MPSEFVLNIEKHLAHIAQTHFPNPYAKNMKGTRAFMRAALRNYFRPGKESSAEIVHTIFVILKIF